MRELDLPARLAPAEVRRNRPRRQLGAALIGAGNVANALYLPQLRRPASPFRVVTVYDLDRAAARRAADALDARVAESLLSAVDDDEVRAVFVCIPNWAHHEAAVTALELRRHVLCEKPLGRTADEALSLLRAAERAGVAHMVNFTYRFRPETAAARRLIRAGILGKVYHAHGTLSQGRWFSPDGRPSDERGDATAWRFGPDGSVVLDLASHLVDMCALLGDIDWVQAWATTFQVDAPPAEDASGFSLGFANGPVAHLLTSRWATGHKEHLSLEIAGSHGAIAFDRAGVRLWTRHDPVWRAVPTPAVRTFLESFHAAISGHDADVPSFRDGAWNNLVLDAIVRSARSGVVVALSPSRLNSLDPRANQYLTPRA